MTTQHDLVDVPVHVPHVAVPGETRERLLRLHPFPASTGSRGMPSPHVASEGRGRAARALLRRSANLRTTTPFRLSNTRMGMSFGLMRRLLSRSCRTWMFHPSCHCSPSTNHE